MTKAKSAAEKIVGRLKRLLPDNMPNPEPGSGTERCKVNRAWVTAALQLKGKIEKIVNELEKYEQGIQEVLQTKDEQIASLPGMEVVIQELEKRVQELEEAGANAVTELLQKNDLIKELEKEVVELKYVSPTNKESAEETSDTDVLSTKEPMA